MRTNIILETSSNSHVGKVRKANEDSFGEFETVNGYVYVVCDGMGGHVGGQEASTTAVGSIISFLKSDFISSPQKAISDALYFANETILQKANNNPGLKGMGTTAVIVLFRNNDFYIGHVGDSRIYLLCDNYLRRLTKDHSVVQKLIDAGELSESESETHSSKNQILQALGHKGVIAPTVSQNPIRLKKGDMFLLCSDGLNGMVHELQIRNILIDNKLTLDKKVDTLIENANTAGGKDNTTVTLIQIKESPYNQSSFQDFTSDYLMNMQIESDEYNKNTKQKPKSNFVTTQEIDNKKDYIRTKNEENIEKPKTNKKIIAAIAAIAAIAVIILGISLFFVFNTKNTVRVYFAKGETTIDSIDVSEKEDFEKRFSDFIEKQKNQPGIYKYTAVVIGTKKELAKGEYEILSEENKKFRLTIIVDGSKWVDQYFKTEQEGKDKLAKLKDKSNVELVLYDQDKNKIAEYKTPKNTPPDVKKEDTTKKEDIKVIETVNKFKEYPENKKLSNNYFKVKDKSGKWGFASKDSVLIGTCEYEEIADFSENFCKVKKGGKYGFVNTKIELKIPCNYSTVRDFNEGFVAVWDDTESSWIYLDQDNEKLVYDFKDKVTQTTDFNYERAAVYNGKEWGFINTGGKLIKGFIYATAQKYTEDKNSKQDNIFTYVRMKKDGVEIRINKNGDEIK